VRWEHGAEVSAGRTVEGVHYYVGALRDGTRMLWLAQLIGPGAGYTLGVFDSRKKTTELCELAEKGGKESAKKARREVRAGGAPGRGIYLNRVKQNACRIEA